MKPRTERIAAQIECHKVFDRLWAGPYAPKERRAAYSYLQKITGLSEADAHISRFDPETCGFIIRRVMRDYPKLFEKTT